MLNAESVSLPPPTPESQALMLFVRACQGVAGATDPLLPGGNRQSLLQALQDVLSALPEVSSYIGYLAFKVVATSLAAHLIQGLPNGTASKSISARIRYLSVAPNADTIRFYVSELISAALPDFDAGTIKRDCRVSEALEHIAGRCGERSLTLGTVASAVGLSRWHLAHILQRQTGMSFREHVCGARIALAKTLLRRRALSVKEVAYTVGLSVRQFDRTFKAHEGRTPLEWRDRLFLGATPDRQ
jgi:AraC-like DNA-binding protein